MKLLASVFIVLILLIGAASAFTPFQALAKPACVAFCDYKAIVSIRENMFKYGLEEALKVVPEMIRGGSAFIVPAMMRVTVDDSKEQFYHITLPDGRNGWILRNQVI